MPSVNRTGASNGHAATRIKTWVSAFAVDQATLKGRHVMRPPLSRSLRCLLGIDVGLERAENSFARFTAGAVMVQTPSADQQRESYRNGRIGYR
jgi:hypothetical protein